jgi:hypothetical protein
MASLADNRLYAGDRNIDHDSTFQKKKKREKEKKKKRKEKRKRRYRRGQTAS